MDENAERAGELVVRTEAARDERIGQTTRIETARISNASACVTAPDLVALIGPRHASALAR
jgi:hypothetical protein